MPSQLHNRFDMQKTTSACSGRGSFLQTGRMRMSRLPAGRRPEPQDAGFVDDGLPLVVGRRSLPRLSSPAQTRAAAMAAALSPLADRAFAAPRHPER
jgi:hypothetical protein